MYGSANENVECIIKNKIASGGFGAMKFVIWFKCVKGIKAIERKIIE